MQQSSWRAYLACAISFYAIVGITILVTPTQTGQRVTALVGLSVAVTNLAVFGGWNLYQRGVKA